MSKEKTRKKRGIKIRRRKRRKGWEVRGRRA
jgi:hypothetical protein